VEQSVTNSESFAVHVLTLYCSPYVHSSIILLQGLFLRPAHTFMNDGIDDGESDGHESQVIGHSLFGFFRLHQTLLLLALCNCLQVRVFLLVTANVIVGLSLHKYSVGSELGTKDGKELGPLLGIELGKELGVELETTLGNVLDIELGREDGKELGLLLGIVLGTALGPPLAKMNGSELGTKDGKELGILLGIELGKELGAELEITLGNVLGIELGREDGKEPGLLLGIVLRKEVLVAAEDLVGFDVAEINGDEIGGSDLLENVVRPYVEGYQ